VTYGVTPTRADTGYGYIATSEVLGDENIFVVNKFIEKPNLKKALEYFSSGQHYCNSGIFMFRASQYLAELELYAPDILHACRASINNASRDLDFIRLDKTLFRLCRSDSIDSAIMEKTKNAVLLPLNVGWSDIGSWSALHDIQECDATFFISEGESTYIPKAVKHRLANFSSLNVEIIETQLGSYLGDDIIRYEDTYGRATSTPKI